MHYLVELYDPRSLRKLWSFRVSNPAKAGMTVLHAIEDDMNARVIDLRTNKVIMARRALEAF